MENEELGKLLITLTDAWSLSDDQVGVIESLLLAAHSHGVVEGLDKSDDIMQETFKRLDNRLMGE
jgi:hypothetical protein